MFRTVMQEAGWILPEEWIVETDWTMQGGYDGLMQVREAADSLPTAIVGSADLVAIGVIRALNDSGLQVPEDISVVGFDNIDYTKFCVPRLTTVDSNRDAMSRFAVRRLMDKLADPQSPSIRTVCPVELVLRDSTHGRTVQLYL